MRSFDTFPATLPTELDPVIRSLIDDRIADSITSGLQDLTHILVVEPGDTESDIVEAIGFSPLTERIEGIRYGDPRFQPDWDYREVHVGWFELLYCIAGSSFAYFIFVQNADGVLPDLLNLIS